MAMKNVLEALRAIGMQNLGYASSYAYRKAWIEAHWESPDHSTTGLTFARALRRRLAQDDARTWPAHWESPGAVCRIQNTSRGARLTTQRGAMEIDFLASDLVRITIVPANEPPAPPVPYAIAKPPEAWDIPPFTSLSNDEALFLHTDTMTLGVMLETSRIFIADAHGHLLRADLDVGFAPRGAIRHRTSLSNQEQIFGLGEHTTPGNRRGRTHIMWNRDPAGYTAGDEPINLNIPVYLGIQPGAQAYLVFYENPTYAEFDLGYTTDNVAEHRFAGGMLRYYVAIGTTAQVLTRYTELTGRHPLPPLWMLGYQQSRWSYASEERVRKLARDFQEHEVPCDVIYLDIDYMDGFRCFTWDRQRFPDLPGLAADLREQGIKLITIIDPGIKRDPDYAVYREGVQGQHFCTLPDGNIFHAPVWPGMCAFPDFTNPATRRWWGELYRPLVDIGIAGFWNDMNEPAVFSNGFDPTLPEPVQHHLEGRGGDHRQAHNIYGMQEVRATHEGLSRLRPDHRPVVITRAGWAGVQRYALSWTGDNESSWESLKLTIPMVVGLGLSGLGFTGADVGGFVGEADGELFTRWIQMGAFMPLYRAHTVLGTPDQEPWSYGEPYLSIVRRFIQLRYELLPYLYTATWQMSTRGWPMVRPLWWDDPQAPRVDDSFLCGDHLLVAPITEPQTDTREVVLPQGTWYEFWTNRRYQSAVTAYAPLETMPLFVREGAVLTLGEYGASVERRLQKFLRLHLYPLTTDGQAVTELYEDAGDGYGDSRLSRFTQQRAADKLILTWESAGDYRPPYEHIELLLNGLDRAPREVRADGEPYPLVSVDPVRHTALLGVPLFSKLEIAL